jgi:hypothetical protein
VGVRGAEAGERGRSEPSDAECSTVGLGGPEVYIPLARSGGAYACVCVFVYMHVCVYVFVYMHVSIYIYAFMYMHVCMYVCMCASVYVLGCLWRIGGSAHAYTYKCMCLCLYVC